MCFALHFFDTFSTSEPPKVVRNCQFFNTFDLKMGFAPQRCALFRYYNLQNWSESLDFCIFLTWKCASRHNGMHFFDILTSKSGPDLMCFVPFDLEMCFAPQRRALFRHLNFQKCSDTGVFCTFLTSKCASRHNGVQFFDISTSKSGPNLVYFVYFHLEMCFAP